MGLLNKLPKEVQEAFEARERLEAESAEQNRKERRARAFDVIGALTACEEELARLEDIPSREADDTNALSAAKGYAQRARVALARRFDPDSLKPEESNPWA